MVVLPTSVVSLVVNLSCPVGLSILPLGQVGNGSFGVKVHLKKVKKKLNARDCAVGLAVVGRKRTAVPECPLIPSSH